MNLLRHEVDVRASLSCPGLVFGWLGFVSGLFGGSGFGLGFLGLWKSLGKALENWLGGLVSESGLILGDFSCACL